MEIAILWTWYFCLRYSVRNIFQRRILYAILLMSVINADDQLIDEKESMFDSDIDSFSSIKWSSVW